MRRFTLGTVAAIVCVAIGTQSLAQKQPPAGRPAPTQKTNARSAPEAPPNPEEKSIRAVADAYVKAYNAHDAKAIGGLFTADAQIVDEEGDAIQGRAAIEKVFAGIFQEYPQARTSVSIQSIRFLSPSLAVEDGTATVVLAPNEPEEPNRYTVVHVKQEGKWLMASALDLPNDTSSAESQLKQLAWLIGDWIDESPQGLMLTSYRWDENHNFLLSDFTVQVAGRPVMNGSQRIGWDPLAKVIRSWVFDSEGGFAEGVYSRAGNQWIIKLTGVTRDGKIASSTNTITRDSKDRTIWGTRDRMVGGEPVGDEAQVLVVRKPPQPKQSQ